MKLKCRGTAIVSADYHTPFQDQRVIREVELFMQELQPEYLFYPGDIVDCYELSKFDKDPARRGKLQEELDVARAMFTRQRKLCPNAQMIFELGNHEDRLRRYLWSKAPELESLRCLKLEELLGLKDNEVTLVAKDEGIHINGNLLITHSELVRAHSGWTAKGMSDKHGGSGIHGHTHRLGSYYKTTRSGMFGWWENGCLCHLNPDYVVHPNWQQGFSVVNFGSSDRFWVEQLPIIHRKFMYGGKVYGSGGKKREV